MSRRGFTFVELMMSILIMIGSSVIVAQGLTRWTKTSETRGAVADVAALLRRAASHTQGASRPYVIELATASVQTLVGKRWSVDSAGKNATFVKDRVVPLAKSVNSATFVGTKSPLVIDAGGPANPTSVLLSLTDRGRTVEWTITLNPDGSVTQGRVEK